MVMATKRKWFNFDEAVGLVPHSDDEDHDSEEESEDSQNSYGEDDDMPLSDGADGEITSEESEEEDNEGDEIDRADGADGRIAGIGRQIRRTHTKHCV